MGINIQKECTKCTEIKSVQNFGKDKSKKDGLSSWCKDCHKQQSKKYLLLHPNCHKDYHINNPNYLTDYYQDNKEKRKLYRQSWKTQNPLYYTFYSKKYNKDNPHLYSWRQLLYRTLYCLGQLKESHTHELLKYSALELKEHLDKQNMNWKNDHIDHKIPVTWFKSTTPPHIVNDLRNLHPLNKDLNIQKSNKFCHPICKDYYNIVIEWVLEDKIKKLDFYK